MIAHYTHRVGLIEVIVLPPFAAVNECRIFICSTRSVSGHHQCDRGPALVGQVPHSEVEEHKGAEDLGRHTMIAHCTGWVGR
jgi:hypothetical protein